MSSAGQQLTAGRIPGERIATTEITSDSSTFTTTETEVATVTAALVDGRTYRVRATPGWQSSVAGDNVAGRIREDNVSGTTRQRRAVDIEVNATLYAWSTDLEFEYTATASADKTFSLTGQRIAGTGNCYLETTDIPCLFYVDYIRG